MILIVDDRPENIYSLQKTLEAAGLVVDTAGSGEQALKKILKTAYELIILDVQMPGMDGYEVAETLSGHSRAKDIPIIFLSAVNKDKRFITKGYATGGIDYITKPVDPDVLLLKVQTFTRLYRQAQELRNAQYALQEEVEVRRQAQDALIRQAEALEQAVADRTARLMETNNALESSNHDLQQFASVASHDLKEPLRKIRMFISIISDKLMGGDTEALTGYLDRISASAERMTGLINDLLAFSKLSVHTLFEPVDLNEIVEEIISDLELQIREKNASIICSRLPVLEAVSGQLRQVFQNILSNAIKFSAEGTEPIVRITTERTVNSGFDSPADEQGAWWRIKVTDNGIGFDEKYLDRIFTLFQRLHTRVQYEGTGIGLAITKKIMDRHNGFITARSKEGEGSTFILMLPSQQPTDRQLNGLDKLPHGQPEKPAVTG